LVDPLSEEAMELALEARLRMFIGEDSASFFSLLLSSPVPFFFDFSKGRYLFIHDT
jgi:hypothetical protein